MNAAEQYRQQMGEAGDPQQATGGPQQAERSAAAAQYEAQMSGSVSGAVFSKPDDGEGQTKAAAARGAAGAFGFASNMGAMIGKAISGIGIDFPVLTHGGQAGEGFSLTPISQASFEDMVGTSENLSRIMNELGVNTEQSANRSDAGKWGDMAVEMAVAGGPFIAKSIAAGGTKAAMAKLAAAETGAVLGSAGAMQMAEDQGPVAQITAAILGDIAGRTPANAMAGALKSPAAAVGGGKKLLHSFKGSPPRVRAASEVRKYTPNPQELINTIDANPQAKSIYDLPGKANTEQLANRVASLNPEARVASIRAAKTTQMNEIAKLVDKVSNEGIIAAQKQISGVVDDQVRAAQQANLQSLDAVHKAIAGLDGGNAEQLVNSAKKIVVKNNETTKASISSKFKALSGNMSRRNFIDVVKNTKAQFVGKEASIPDLTEIKSLHEKINTFLVAQEPTFDNFQSVLSDISATERNILLGGSKGTYSTGTIKNYLSALEDSMLDAYGRTVGKTSRSMFQSARKEWKNYRDLYDRSILSAFSEPDFIATPNLSSFIGTGTEGAENLDIFLKGAPEGEPVMREYLLTNFLRGRESLTDAQFTKLRYEYGPSIRRLGISGDLDNMQGKMRAADAAADNLSRIEKEFLSEKSVYTLFTGSAPKFAVRNILDGENKAKNLKAAYNAVRLNKPAKNGLLGGIFGDFIESSRVGKIDDPVYSGVAMRSWIKANEEALTGIPEIGEKGVAWMTRISEEIDNTLTIMNRPPPLSSLASETPLAVFYARIMAVEGASKSGLLSGTPGGSMQKAQQVASMATRGMQKLQRLDEVEAIMTKAVTGDLGDLRLLVKEGMTQQEATKVADRFKSAGIKGLDFFKDKTGKIKWKLTPVGTPSLVGATAQATEEYDGSE